jgi:hypothetical protein
VTEVKPRARQVIFSEKLRLKYPHVFSHVPLASVSFSSLSPSLPTQSGSLSSSTRPTRTSRSTKKLPREVLLTMWPELSGIGQVHLDSVHNNCHCHYFVLYFGGSKIEHGLYLSVKCRSSIFMTAWISFLFE